jgi:hypothetical protein
MKRWSLRFKKSACSVDGCFIEARACGLAHIRLHYEKMFRTAIETGNTVETIVDDMP